MADDSRRWNNHMDHKEGNTLLCETVKKFTKQRVQEIQSEPIKTGFDNLDDLLGGGITPGLTVLGAVSSLGKSTLALQIAENMSKQGTTVLFFSMEMTKERIAAKAMSRQIFLTIKKEHPDSLNAIQSDDCNLIQSNDFFYKEKTDTFTEEMWEMVQEAGKTVKEQTRNLHIIEGGLEMQSGQDIYDYVKDFLEHHQEDEKPPVVMVDYLQILTCLNDIAMPKAVVDENIRMCKTIAHELGKQIPVIVISSVNRENYNKPIAFESFKESGNIEYTADVVLGLQLSAAREANGRYFDMNAEKAACPRRVEVVTLKHRYHQCDGIAAFDYYAKFDCFEEKSQPQISTKPARRYAGHTNAAGKKPEAVKKKATEMSRKEFEAWLKENSGRDEDGRDNGHTHQ